MHTYTIKAQLNNVKSVKTIYAADDFEATLRAITVILDKAYADKEGVWAKGQVRLLNTAGEVIQEMPAK